MHVLKLALIAGAATALSSATFAADLLIDNRPIAPTIVDNSFTWDGAYIGVFGSGQSTPSVFGIGVDVGANALTGPVLIGGELSASWLTDNSWSAQAHGRLGVLATDNVAVYALAGIGTNSLSGTYVPVGVGAEFGLTDGLSLKTEYQYQFDLSSAAQDSHVIKAGLNWHF